MIHLLIGWGCIKPYRGRVRSGLHTFASMGRKRSRLGSSRWGRGHYNETGGGGGGGGGGEMIREGLVILVLARGFEFNLFQGQQLRAQFQPERCLFLLLAVSEVPRHF